MKRVLPPLLAILIFFTAAIPAFAASYVVQPGDTLYSIAVRYGTTVDALMAANGLTSSVIWVGQTLQVRSSSTPSPTGTSYTVVRGDTLYSIARRYGTTVDAIMQANHLTSTYIYVGQRLIISSSPVPPTSGTTYTVVQGDTLYSIARRYGTTVEAIMAANHLSSTRIYVGQRLLITSTNTPLPPTASSPTATTVATATPNGTPAPTAATTLTPSPTTSSTIPPTQTPTTTGIPTSTHTPSPTLQPTTTATQMPTQTATPSPTTTSQPTEEERIFVEQVLAITAHYSEAFNFLSGQLIALSNNPDLVMSPDWVIRTVAATQAIRIYNDQIRSLNVPPRYVASANELRTAANLLDQALDALLLGIDNRDIAQINLFSQHMSEAILAIERAKAALPTP